MNYLINPFKQIIDFRGRATRKEYWMFLLLNILISVAYGVVVIIIGFYTANDLTGSVGMFILLLSLVMFIYLLFFFVVSISLTIRRLHDINLSGWWILIGYIPFVGNIILFILSIIPSYKEENKYGPCQHSNDNT